MLGTQDASGSCGPSVCAACGLMQTQTQQAELQAWKSAAEAKALRIPKEPEKISPQRDNKLGTF